VARTIGLIGVPSSAGAHWPGQEKAPQYLRDAGLAARLEAVGLRVKDYGDLPRVRFRPDSKNRHQQNLASVVGVARQVAASVSLALQQQTVPLVVGGDCTIALGVLAGFIRFHEDVGLIYFDGHTDLNTPLTSTSGILDSMGVAHMIGEYGTAEELSHIGERFPLLPPERIVLFGYNPREINRSEHEVLARGQLRHYPSIEVERNAVAVAAEARSLLEQRAGRFVLHLDVDAIDFTDMPLADAPQFSRGLSFENVVACLRVFASSPKFAGLTIAEVNPDHADEEGLIIERFVSSLVDVLKLIAEAPD